MQWSDLNLDQWPHQGHPWVTGNFTGIHVSSQKSFESDMKVGQTDGQTDMVIPIPPPNFVRSIKINFLNDDVLFKK